MVLTMGVMYSGSDIQNLQQGREHKTRGAAESVTDRWDPTPN